MRLFRNILNLVYPRLYVYISCSNELSTEGNSLWLNNQKGCIEKMGKNLANEIHEFISNRSYLSKVRISFIGFSMGGIIVRAALPFLE
jgi:hypothetical protein